MIWKMEHNIFKSIQDLTLTVFEKVKISLDERILFFLNHNLTPLDMYNGLSQVNCIKPEGRIH